MKIVTWNVNGLRAVHRKGEFLSFVKKYRPDVLCLQETKADEDQLEKAITNIPGYLVFFSSSQKKKGYSGVAVYTKHEPKDVVYGMGREEFDNEGRILEMDFGGFVLLNIYFPNAGPELKRLDYKMEFYDYFLKHIERLRKKGKHIVFCGDVNTAHNEIDLARPKENEKNTGFLPVERAWLDKVVGKGYVDVFRHFYPQKVRYTWWTYRAMARERNVGWRLDYFFCNKGFLGRVKDVKILSDVFGSDHCPVLLRVD